LDYAAGRHRFIEPIKTFKTKEETERRRYFSTNEPLSSMKLKLPQVSLVLMETRAHRLARLAVEDCLRHVDFGDVVIFSDQFNELRFPGAHLVLVQDFPSKLEWCKALWHIVPLFVRTTHALLIQWDSWVLDPAMWRDDWLQYDYIGAPWGWPDALNVGNSGFSIRSRRLMDVLRENEETYPVITDGEDELLCRRYRPSLEGRGLRWAPVEEAQAFAFERMRPGPESKHFGFHGIYNWPYVLDRDRFRERMMIHLQPDFEARCNDLWDRSQTVFPWNKPIWNAPGVAA
jgi:hypothetical protein